MPKKIVSNDFTFKKPGIFWHSDNSHFENPSHLSVFQMLEIPREGAVTHFISLIGAYENLSKEQRKEWGCYMVNYANLAEHPLVWKHPFRGKNVIYFDFGMVNNIINLKMDDDSLSLTEVNSFLNDISEHFSKLDCTYTHKWKKGDIVITDNYAIAHRADLNIESRKRVLVRATTEGIYF